MLCIVYWRELVCTLLKYGVVYFIVWCEFTSYFKLGVSNHKEHCKPKVLKEAEGSNLEKVTEDVNHDEETSPSKLSRPSCLTTFFFNWAEFSRHIYTQYYLMKARGRTTPLTGQDVMWNADFVNIFLPVVHQYGACWKWTQENILNHMQAKKKSTTLVGLLQKVINVICIVVNIIIRMNS